MNVFSFGLCVALINFALIIATAILLDLNFKKLGSIIICFICVLFIGCTHIVLKTTTTNAITYNKTKVYLESVKDASYTKQSFYLILGTGAGSSNNSTNIIYYTKYFDTNIDEYALKRHETPFDYQVSIVEQPKKEFEGFSKPYLIKITGKKRTETILGIKFFEEADIIGTNTYFFIPEGSVKKEFRLDQ